MLDFAHLHVHTDASQDGLGTVQHLVTVAKASGFRALAMTDHGSLANAISFTVACEQAGLKPIIGMEAYVGINGERFHLTLLADGNIGFNTLVELNNLGARGEDTSRPTFQLGALRKYNEGLVVLSGCPASPLQKLEWPEALEIGRELKNVFGPRLFAEAMFVSTTAPWERSMKLVRDLKLAPVVTNDVHYASRDDHQAHELATQLRSGFSYDGSLLFLATPGELQSRVTSMAPGYTSLLSAGLTNAGRIAARLKPVTFDAKPKLPVIPNADAELDRLTRAGLVRLFDGKIPPEYLERVEYELKVIAGTRFSSYFIILQDMIEHARSAGVRVGPGRGSGAGSLVLYAIGGSEIDPLKYNLSFDRFLNYKRAEAPDVDTDFESERRPIVMNYAKDRWGAQGVATYMRWSHKSLTHDLCRMFHVPRDIDEAAADGGVDSGPFKRIINDYPGFYQAYQAMLGQIKTIGQHAGGVTIIDGEYAMPLTRTKSGEVVAAWTEGEYRELSRAGIVKFDLLGLSALSILRRLEEKHGRRASQPVDDDPVFELFRSGDLTGIFQFAGSQGILDFTVKVGPRSFEDLVAINALYRPGALDSGAALHYPEWRKEPRKLHPLVDDILAGTFGVICYQEQFMAIFARITGEDMAGADLARKVLSKARPGQADWEEKMAKLNEKFFAGAKAHGLDDEVASKIWGEITTHTRYSFNRSHSVAYAMVAWEMAWWKFHHQVDFYAALLSVDKEEWQRYLFEVIAKSIEVVPPHINRSTSDFESDGKRIYMPLSIVKYLGDTGVQAILNARPFKSVEDFMARVPKRSVPKRPRQGLLGLGAFEGIDGDYKALEIGEMELLTPEAAQARYLGLILPTQKVLAAIEAASKRGLVGGIIASVEMRKSEWGEYAVYKLMPRGTFWSRDMKSLAVGEQVRFKIRKDSGKILQVLPLL